ncbi:MAG: PA3496 family putative envelope integrity protein [Gammaproteobacteria bacterium]
MASKKQNFDDDIESFDDDIKNEDYLSDEYAERKSSAVSPKNASARRSLELIFEQRELERLIYDDFVF